MGHQKSKFSNDQTRGKEFTTLTSSQSQYICRHTNLVDNEVYRRHHEFLKICKDGQLMKEQFTSILQEIWPTGNVHNFSNYLFKLCDKDQKGFLEFTEFIILNCQLNNDKSYLGFLFDMFDTRHQGSLPLEQIELLFASLFELIGHPTDEQCGANISQRQIVHLLQVVDESKSKCLSRDQFMNIGNTNWTDEENGIGTLLIEHSC
ncbi:unnamed protein product [Rotaria sp. Silwood1]|nr:unnamed protein product [Rotaria sp. Silwood1]CAF1009111.1 unnamed protein product [Rotaria sp. Silwood1]CAF4742449.1 unnamed protein product [Rotaria sp. Silwood1]CAF4860308.1 unnamed protein product [Rotaria sp. Silwood1]CAF5025137.1 unnamed protein product [Rotaria sp. Silwood1]